MRDLIDRQAAIDIVVFECGKWTGLAKEISKRLKQLPSAQPTLYGYNIEHLELIARVLQKENLPPERVAEMLFDIGRIVSIVCDEFEESLRQMVIDTAALTKSSTEPDRRKKDG